MHVTRDGKRRRSQTEWKQILSRYRQSGLSLRDFAKQQSVSLASLQRWNRRLGAVAKEQQPEFVDVTPQPTVSATWHAEIEFPGGVIFRLRG